MRSPRGRATPTTQDALRASERAVAPVDPQKPTNITWDGEEKPSRWHLWFAARPALPPALRPRTKAGKPKPSPPRLPPNINERRRMHPYAERDLIAYWLGCAVRECHRQAGMRLLERARISAVIHRPRLGVADASGDSERLKPLVDGLVKAGVLKNDRRREVEYGEVREERIGYRGYGLLLIVEEIASPAPATGAAGAGEE